MSFEELLAFADNVYRTERFIVCQIVGLKSDSELKNVIVSQDTYFARTHARDKVYEDKFWERYEINGKRLPTNMFTRTYID